MLFEYDIEEKFRINKDGDIKTVNEICLDDPLGGADICLSEWPEDGSSASYWDDIGLYIETNTADPNVDVFIYDNGGLSIDSDDVDGGQNVFYGRMNDGGVGNFLKEALKTD